MDTLFKAEVMRPGLRQRIGDGDLFAGHKDNSVLTLLAVSREQRTLVLQRSHSTMDYLDVKVPEGSMLVLAGTGLQAFAAANGEHVRITAPRQWTRRLPNTEAQVTLRLMLGGTW